jgi:hypothetical protein
MSNEEPCLCRVLGGTPTKQFLVFCSRVKGAEEARTTRMARWLMKIRVFGRVAMLCAFLFGSVVGAGLVIRQREGLFLVRMGKQRHASKQPNTNRAKKANASRVAPSHKTLSADR